ncbi:MAG: ATP-binding protein [Ilumatobacteraceae bacterium]|nr:ATP-binding protein [Ilumatobacteraceae bacterium]
MPMAVLMVAGAVVVFLAGWSWARATMAVPPGEGVVTVSPPPAEPTLFQRALERQPIGVVIAGSNGVVEYRNPAAEALAGTHVGALIDGAVTQHLMIAARGAHSDEVLDFFGPPRRVVHVVTEPLDDGRAVAFVTDITERRRVDQVRTDFVANVSHELRTPIGALMVLAETLVGTDDPEIVQRVVRRMQGEADRASHTIDDLLELSQIESGEQRDFGPVRMSDVVIDAVGRVAELAAASDISLSTLDSVGPDGPNAERAVVHGDRRQLSSAVGNLLENAVKYSDPGDVVQIRVRPDADTVEVAVIDEGAGIPRRDLDRVFERFYRVDRARSRSTGGTGLGLSIVRHVVSNHGGSISVDSIEGEGSTFTLRLPLLDAGVSHQSENDQKNDQKNDHEEGVA